MSKSISASVGSAVLAQFALQQDVSLEQMSVGTQQGVLTSADSSVPEWFSAAASSRSSLSETAPELHPNSKHDSFDLVKMYAPELVEAQVDKNDGTRQSVPVNSDLGQGTESGKAIQIGLLKELEDFDT